MAEPVTIAVDVMGGDRGPAVVLRGALQALEADPDLRLTLVGPAEEVEPFAAAHDRATAQVATEVIEMGEHPAGAVRAKKDSSIVVGCRLVKEGAADGFFSAGSTGACLAAATLVVGRIKGVKRPALGQVIPAWARPTLLIDVGANADCKPEYLVQFAQMGEVYMNAIMGVEHPKVGLLNIGEEDTKGDLFAQEAHRLLTEAVRAFAGNCEGGDLMAGDFDVVVTDGFTGNVCLKTIEGAAKTLMRNLKAALMSTALSKVGALLVKGPLGALKEKMSPDTYGGTPLLGVKGAVIVGHGSSNETAVKNLSRLGDKTGLAVSVDAIEGGWLVSFVERAQGFASGAGAGAGVGSGAESAGERPEGASGSGAAAHVAEAAGVSVAAAPHGGVPPVACASGTGCGYAVFVSRDCVGDGDAELGRSLMKMALYTLSESDDVPASLLFMNAGVKLVAGGEAQIAESVRALQEKGTEVLVCGTCLDYYGLTERLEAGEVSNMYDILGRMQEAAKVVTL